MFALARSESSHLAKGIAKEKELARHLRYRHPAAEVNRTSPTGDGGKDIIFRHAGETKFYEIKNWSRSMSAYDIQQYIEMQQSVSAQMEVYNKGGFSSGARSAAQDAGLDLTAGSEYTAPGVTKRLRWGTTRVQTEVGSAIKKCASTLKSITKARQQFLTSTVELLTAIGKSVVERLSARHMAMLGMIIGPIWLVYRIQSDEYRLSDYLMPIILTFGSVIAYRLLDD